MYLFHITSGCLAPPSFRAQDFLLQMKNLHSTLHISEVLGFFSELRVQEPISTRGWRGLAPTAAQKKGGTFGLMEQKN